MAALVVDDKHGKVKRKVSYFYDPDVGNFHYGQGHPMKVSAGGVGVGGWGEVVTYTRRRATRFLFNCNAYIPFAVCSHTGYA